MINSKIFILPLILASVSAGAMELSIYYDTNPDTSCETFCSIPYQGEGCCPEANVITQEAIFEKFAASAEVRGETFSGFKLSDGSELMNSSGELKLTGAQVAAKGSIASGATLRTTNTCAGTSERNPNGVCTEPDGEYYDKGGNTVPSSGLTCWRWENGKKVNYCYWRVNVIFHDKPTSGANGITVNNGNEGLKLNCNGGSGCVKDTSSGIPCVEYNGAGTCTHIRTPNAPGYSFRGYYLGKIDGQVVSLPSDIIAEHSTTEGGAFSNFFPKNLNSSSTSILGHAIVVMSDTPVPITNPGAIIETTAPIDVEVYGGWARDCATDHLLNPAGCLMRLGQTYNTNSYGLGKGDVRYDTQCRGGQHVTSSSSGTYNPQCEDDTGDITFTYNFHNQYGEPIECGSVTPSACTTGNNVSLVSASNFSAACGSEYVLRYLYINDEWYRPSYQAGCNTNVFGQSGQVTIEGYACETCKDAEAPEHGHCEDMTSSVQINYNPVSPDHNGVGSSGYTVGYGGLWGADPNGSNAYPACRKIVCDAGYQLWTYNNGTRSCITDREACLLKNPDNPSICDEIGFTCPSTGYTPVANSLVTISGPNKSGTTCSYTIGCSAGVPEWETGATAGSTVVTCTGSQCTSTWVQSQLNGKSCFVCPHYNGADWSVSPGAPTQSGFQCSYHILCNGRVSCPRILKKDGVTITGNSDYVTCDESNNHQCTAGYGPYQSLYFLTTEFGKYECVHNSTTGINDAGCGGSTYTCPTTGLPTISHGEISNTSSCYYQPNCDSGYTCNTSTQLCSEHACNNETNCNALFAQYSDHASDLCQVPIHVDCPDPTGTGVESLEHGEVTLTSSTDVRCTYGFECTESGYQLVGGSTAMCNRNNTSNLCSPTWLNSQIRSHSCQSSGNGKGDEGEGGDGGDKEGESTNSES